MDICMNAKNTSISNLQCTLVCLFSDYYKQKCRLFFFPSAAPLGVTTANVLDRCSHQLGVLCTSGTPGWALVSVSLNDAYSSILSSLHICVINNKNVKLLITS